MSFSAVVDVRMRSFVIKNVKHNVGRGSEVMEDIRNNVRSMFHLVEDLAGLTFHRCWRGFIGYTS